MFMRTALVPHVEKHKKCNPGEQIEPSAWIGSDNTRFSTGSVRTLARWTISTLTLTMAELLVPCHQQFIFQ